MRLDSLTVENYRRFKRAEIEFPDGVIGLVGRNGSGKSTLVEAIGWALFGNDAARTAKDQIRRRGAGPSDDCRVVLRFTFGGHAYEVTRELLGKGQQHVACVVVDGAVVVPRGALSQKAAAETIGRLLHMDHKAFFVSLIARQRELAALSQATPAERKRIVTSLLRIDAIDDAIARAREAKRATRARLDALAPLVPDAAALDAREAGLAKRAADATAGAATVTASLDAAMTAQRVASEAASQWAAKAVEARALAPELADRRARLAAVESERGAVATELSHLAALAGARGSLAADAAPLADARTAVEVLATRARDALEDARRRREHAETAASAARFAAEAARLAEAPARLATLGKAAREVREALAARRAAVTSTRDVAARAEADARHAEAERMRVARDAQKIRDLGPDAPCPTCTRPLREHFGSLTEEFAASLARVDASVAAARDALAAARASLAPIERDVAALVEREAELARNERAAAAVAARLEEVARRASAEIERAAGLAGRLA
ncbi:MAG: AAA family ATPase, partial [Thermoplasmatota archaeon]